MNENNNRVNAALTNTDFNTLKAAIVALDTAVSAFAVGLSNAEREALPKINVADRAFVQDAISLMGTADATSFIPPYLQPADAQVDLALFDQMDLLFALLSPILQKIVDTRILSGSEGYSTALTFYKLAKAAADAGIPGAKAIADQLRQRFAGQGPGGGAGNGE